LNDLWRQLQRDDVKINTQEEIRMVDAVLKTLTDKNNDVKSAAVKCVAALVKKVAKKQITDICKTLCKLVRSTQKDQAELRDIYSIALRTLIEDVPDGLGEEVSTILTVDLVDGVKSDVTGVKRECLLILENLLKRFGTRASARHDDVMNSVLPQLSEDKLIRRAAADTLSALALVASDELLNRLVTGILESLESTVASATPSKSASSGSLESLGESDARTLIQTIGTIARTVGHRLGLHLPRLVPLFVSFIGSAASNDSDDDNDDRTVINEIREYCFSGLECFVKCCPVEIAPYLNSNMMSEGDNSNILNLSMSFIRYDPNYVGNDEDNAMDESDEEEDSDEEVYSDEDSYSEDDDDDDDTSWKVRRSAVKVIRAIIEAHPELHSELYESHADSLLARFKERAEQVRVDIIDCFSALLDSTISHDSKSALSGSMVSSAGKPKLIRQRSTVHYLYEKLNDIVNTACKQLQGPDKDVQTKAKTLDMLCKLIVVLRGGLDRAQVETVFKNLMTMIGNSKLSSLRVQQLTLVSLIVEHHEAGDIQDLLAGKLQTSIDRPLNILPTIIMCTTEVGYKNIAWALHVLDVMIAKIRPMIRDVLGFDTDGDLIMSDSTVKDPTNVKDTTAYAKQIYQAVLPHFEAQDVDQEIKKMALQTMASLFFHMGDLNLNEELQQTLKILEHRIGNEITRVSALRALARMAKSPIKMDLTLLDHACLGKIAQYARQQSREVRMTAIQALDALVQSVSFDANTFGVDLTECILLEASTLVTHTDLHLAQLALNLCTSLISRLSVERYQKALFTHVYGRAIALASSPLTHGPSQKALEIFLQKLVALNLPEMSFDDVQSALYAGMDAFSSDGSASPKRSKANGSSSSGKEDTVSTSTASKKQSGLNLARCIAAICIGASNSQQEATVSRLASDIGASSLIHAHLALLCIGELGRRMDVASLTTASLEEKIMQLFHSPSPDTQVAASFALGSLAMGNINRYLPVILKVLDSESQKYLPLAALRELIQGHVDKGKTVQSSDFSKSLSQIMTAVMPAAASEEAQIRNVAAECLGLLSSMHPDFVLPQFQILFGDDKTTWHSRWTLATALKFTFAHRLSEEVHGQMTEALSLYLGPLLRTEEIDVRKAAVMATSSIIHRNPELIVAPCTNSLTDCTILEHILPELITAMQYTQKVQVDTGNFKVTQDLGLTLRTAALACLDTLIDALPEKVIVPTFLPAVVCNIGDQLKVKPDTSYLIDIKTFVHAIVIKLCKLAPGPMLGGLEHMLEPLKKTIEQKPDDNLPQKEAERIHELRKSALRVILHFRRLEGIQASASFREFQVNFIMKNTALVSQLEQLQEDIA
jgi:cullin-associated NEDD8-dissociated protein 1